MAPASLAVGTFLLRLLFAAKRPTDWDSAQFVFGTRHLDVTHGSPHPPGYFFYVEYGRLLHAITGLNATDSLVLLSAAASAAASGVIYLAARQFVGPWAALAAGALVATSPVAWFAGSIVDTYSFDELAAALLLLLARRARPGSRDGALALFVLALIGGFRQSVLETLLLLALVAVAASVRTLRAGVVAAGAGILGLLLWLLPLSLSQPGGLLTWYRATHHETVGAYHTSSLLMHNTAGRTNLGVLGAYTVIMLGSALLLAILGLAGILLMRMRSAGELSSPESKPESTAEGSLPWYQRTPALLVIGVVPPIGVFTFIEFGKGGYALAFVPTATILLLVPLSKCSGYRSMTRSFVLAVACVLVGATVLINVQRFTAGKGILPKTVVTHLSGLWLTQARYGAPYPETAATIRAADASDLQLQRLQSVVRPAGDVLVMSNDQPYWSYFRDAGWALADVRVVLVARGTVLLEELHGLLYYERGGVLQLGAGQRALFLVTNVSAELEGLQRAALARPLPAGAVGAQLWQIDPGATYLGIRVVHSPSPAAPAGDILHPAVTPAG
jgi:hypothetical protein